MFSALYDVKSVAACVSESKWWEDKAMWIFFNLLIPHVQSERKVQHFRLLRAYLAAAVAATTVSRLLEE